MNETIALLAGRVLDGELLERAEIDTLLRESEGDYDDLLYWANKIRQKFFGNKIKVCSIVPGRLGGCDQDCAFCAQSARFNTAVGKKPQFLSDEEILAGAAQAAKNKVSNFGIVYSGRAVTATQLGRIEKLVRRIKDAYDLGVCGSFGLISSEQAMRLGRAGMSRYNHNLETSERYFPSIVTTHEYADRVRTIEVVKGAGLAICAGGIFGIGETEADRVDMALELRRLGADTVPMNFLHPIKGTPLGRAETIKPRQILRIVAIFRFILPKTNLKIAGGRVLNLRDLQSWMFYAGATSILSGDYLTTSGRAVSEDMQMLADMGLEVTD
ncbi:MAG TPA: biotin synthase BioB [Planctomycetes bacterium]|nr:biotin synthase BioB [Planctomycetota bacterium]HIJ71317.1 biotin synthase BioB [Planctomycetota bacterium]